MCDGSHSFDMTFCGEVKFLLEYALFLLFVFLCTQTILIHSTTLVSVSHICVANGCGFLL